MVIYYNGARYTGTATPHSSTGYTGGGSSSGGSGGSSGGSTSNKGTAYYDPDKGGVVTSDGRFYPTSNKDWVPTGYTKAGSTPQSQPTGQSSGNAGKPGTTIKSASTSYSDMYSKITGQPTTGQNQQLTTGPHTPNLPFNTEFQGGGDYYYTPKYGIQTDTGYYSTPSGKAVVRDDKKKQTITTPPKGLKDTYMSYYEKPTNIKEMLAFPFSNFKAVKATGTRVVELAETRQPGIEASKTELYGTLMQTPSSKPRQTLDVIKQTGKLGYQVTVKESQKILGHMMEKPVLSATLITLWNPVTKGVASSITKNTILKVSQPTISKFATATIGGAYVATQPKGQRIQSAIGLAGVYGGLKLAGYGVQKGYEIATKPRYQFTKITQERIAEVRKSPTEVFVKTKGTGFNEYRSLVGQSSRVTFNINREIPIKQIGLDSYASESKVTIIPKKIISGGRSVSLKAQPFEFTTSFRQYGDVASGVTRVGDRVEYFGGKIYGSREASLLELSKSSNWAKQSDIEILSREKLLYEFKKGDVTARYSLGQTKIYEKKLDYMPKIVSGVSNLGVAKLSYPQPDLVYKPNLFLYRGETPNFSVPSPSIVIPAIPSSVLITSMELKSRTIKTPIISGKSKISSDLISRQTSIQVPRTTTSVIDRQITIPDQELVPRQTFIERIVMEPLPQVPVIPSTPIIPSPPRLTTPVFAPIFGGSGVSRPVTKSRKFKRKRSYAPSVWGLEKGLRTPKLRKKDLLSGLEIRGV